MAPIKPANARIIARRKNELGRALKSLRDGVGDAQADAETCVRLTSEVPFGGVARLLHDLGMADLSGCLRAGQTDALARRSPAYREVRPLPAPVDTTPSALVDPTSSIAAEVEVDEAAPPHRPHKQESHGFRTLRAEEVLEIHFALVEDFARTPDPIVPPGVKHPDLLESATARQFTSLGGEPKYKTLEHMAADTSVRLVYLEALEEERFKDLPSAQVIVRGYLSAYLSALGMDPEATLTDYLGRFQRWQGKSLR